MSLTLVSRAVGGCSAAPLEAQASGAGVHAAWSAVTRTAGCIFGRSTASADGDEVENMLAILIINSK